MVKSNVPIFKLIWTIFTEISNLQFYWKYVTLTRNSQFLTIFAISFPIHLFRNRTRIAITDLWPIDIMKFRAKLQPIMFHWWALNIDRNWTGFYRFSSVSHNIDRHKPVIFRLGQKNVESFTGPSTAHKNKTRN